MNTDGTNGDGPEPVGGPTVKTRRAGDDVQRVIGADQSAADADQSAADADQTSSDTDQTASGSDQITADRDQRASDHDQEAADRDHAAHPDLSSADEAAYVASREERTKDTFDRIRGRLRRSAEARQRDHTADERDRTADERDRTADTRDAISRARDKASADHAPAVSESEVALLRQLDELAAKAAVDRARAAAERERAAVDRAVAARERARLEAELRSAHLDELTGAYRREMGRLAISHEIDRARRSDGRFVLAFVDVDRLKAVNDRDGHAAGDRVLQSVVHAIRTRLRSFDPIVRYGGDEFVCGLGGTDIIEARRRFESIGIAIEADAQVGISVGLAALAPDDTTDLLTERADAAMLEVKARHHSGD